MAKDLRVAVLISGNGSNLQALIDACQQDIPATIDLVISDKQEAYGLTRAARANIATATVNRKDYDSRESFDEAIHALLVEHDIEFVCLAGYMRLLSAPFVEKWHGKMVNIHPSLLPLFKGLNVQQAAIDAGVRLSGCTVHFVVPEVDSGPIITQAAVPLYSTDTAETLTKRIHQVEHICYPKALSLIANNQVRLEGDKVVFESEEKIEGSLVV